MSLRKHVPRVVLAAGIFASIATQQVSPQWTLEAGEGLVPQVLDDATTVNVRLATATLTGPERLGFIQGSIRVHLELRPRDVSGVRPAMIDLELAPSRRDGPSDRELIAVAPGGTAIVDLFLPAFQADCIDRTTCSDLFELTFRRTPVVDDPIIEITGTVEVDAIGNGSTVPPPGTTLELDVGDIGPVP